jgi:hypothetical protein
LDLSEPALAARNETDSAYVRSVVIDKNGVKQSQDDKEIMAYAPVTTETQPTADERAALFLSAAELILKGEKAASVSSETQLPTPQTEVQAQPPQLETYQSVSPQDAGDTSIIGDTTQTTFITQVPEQQTADAARQALAARLRQQAETIAEEAHRNNAEAMKNLTQKSETQPATISATAESNTRTSPSASAPTREFYGIQLMGASDLHQLKEALQNLSIDAKKINVIQQKTSDNRTRFIAIYGQYPTMKSAQKVLNDLPEDVLSEGAFVRKIAAQKQRAS